MANFDTIKTAIDANIKTNGTQEITGGKMNSILKQIVDATDEQLTELESEVNAVANGYIEVPIGGRLIDTAVSEDGVLNSDYYTTQGIWSVYYVKAIAGKTYHIQANWTPSDGGNYFRVGISDNVPKVGVIGTILSEQRVSQNSYVYDYTATSDCYLFWQVRTGSATYNNKLFEVSKTIARINVLEKKVDGYSPIVPEILNGYAVSSDGTLVNDYTTQGIWSVYYVKAIAGKTYHIQANWTPSDGGNYFRVGILDNVPKVGEIGTILSEQIIPENSYVYDYAASSDCYLFWQVRTGSTTHDSEVATLTNFAEEIATINKNIHELQAESKGGNYAKLTFLHWNIAHFSLSSGIVNAIDTDAEYEKYLPIYRKIFNEINADFISICEFESPFWKGHPEYTTKRELFPQYQYYKDNATATSNGMWIAFFSHLPVVDVQEVAFDVNANGNYRYYLVGTLYISGLPVKVVCTHMSYDSNPNIAKSQINQLIETFANDERVIMLADWNVHTPDGYQPLIDAGYTMANCGYLGNIKTCDTTTIEPYIDNIIVKGCNINNIHVMSDVNNGNYLSDHYPIYCDIVVA